MKSNGIVVYRGPSELGGGNVVAIITFRTENRKIGKMAQLWILPDNGLSPLAAVQAGQNQSACGNCALQGQWDAILGKVRNRVCYVNLGQGPRSIHSALSKGRYPAVSLERALELIRGLKLRLGAYGDPAALPIDLIEALVSVSSGHTGYSHQLFWIDRPKAERLAKLVMVSCHNRAQLEEAQRRNWRAFAVVTESQRAQSTDLVECPAYTRGISCEQCLLCRGASLKARSVFVIAHAAVGSNLPAVQATGL